MDENYRYQDEFIRNIEMDRMEKLHELEYRKEIRARKRRTLLTIIAIIAPLPILLAKYFQFSEIYYYTGFGGLILAASVMAFIYLQPERTRGLKSSDYFIPDELNEEFLYLKSKNKDFERQNRDLKNKIDKILNQLQKGDGSEGLFSRNDKDQILKKIQSKLESEGLQEYQANLQSMIGERLKYKNQEDLFLQINSRLESEVQNLAKRGNINLILGMATTLTGLGILGYSVFDAPTSSSVVEIASHFIPRISLVFLIEVFAYFFLKLYKQGLSEIKYFQNEITNIESKFLALRLSSENDHKECIKEVVTSLLSTERNFVLNKGQTTVELEKIKEDQKQRNELMGLLDKALQKIKS